MNSWLVNILRALEGHPSDVRLQAYADGELESEYRREVHRHLEHCVRCRETIGTGRAIMRLIAAVEPDAAIVTGTREQLFRRFQERLPQPAEARMRAEVQGLLGTAAALQLALSSARLSPPVEAQITAFLGARAAMRFRERWMAASGA